MPKKYFPILLSKAGELVALEQLRQNVKDQISPIIEVIDLEKTEASFRNWNFPDNEILFDFSLFGTFNRSVIEPFFNRLYFVGVNAIPVVQSDSSPGYLTLVQSLIVKYKCKVCIRISNSNNGFINAKTSISDLGIELNIHRNNIILLMDLGIADINNYNNIAALAINTILTIPLKAQFDSIIVASSSFPDNLSDLTPAGHLHKLERYEWNIWENILIANIGKNIRYGDYGTKYPFYTEVNFQGSCSIRYTTKTDYSIYRGELSGNHPEGNGQYIIFSKRLIAAPFYSGDTFSWGDNEINRIASYALNDPKKKPGNATVWVKISQNHHITLLHSLL